MIKRYSELNHFPIYSLPSKEERKGMPFEDFHALTLHIRKSKEDLLKKKVLPTGVAATPKDKNGSYEIISKEPTDNSKWRVTRMINVDGEEIPAGHLVCNSLLPEPNKSHLDSVLGSINPDWEKWAEE